MIDFRYHLISIVAVLLALSIGIVMGSGVIGGPLLDDLENRADNVREANDELRKTAAERQTEIDQLESFLDDAEPYLLDSALVGEAVVLFEMPGVGGTVVEELRSSIGLADGAVVSQIEFTDKLEMSDDIERDELALALSSVSGSREELRIEMASMVGSRSAAASEDSDVSEARGIDADQRLDDLLNELEDAGFLALDRTEGRPTVPQGALFIVVGGTDDPPYEMGQMVTELSVELVQGSSVMVGETLDSQAEILVSIIDDGTAEESIATSDGIDTTIGRVAAVLGLDIAADGQIGHYGIGPTASETIPTIPEG